MARDDASAPLNRFAPVEPDRQRRPRAGEQRVALVKRGYYTALDADATPNAATTAAPGAEDGDNGVQARSGGGLGGARERERVVGSVGPGSVQSPPQRGAQPEADDDADEEQERRGDALASGNAAGGSTRYDSRNDTERARHQGASVKRGVHDHDDEAVDDDERRSLVGSTPARSSGRSGGDNDDGGDEEAEGGDGGGDEEYAPAHHRHYYESRSERRREPSAAATDQTDRDTFDGLTWRNYLFLLLPPLALLLLTLTFRLLTVSLTFVVAIAPALIAYRCIRSRLLLSASAPHAYTVRRSALIDQVALGAVLVPLAVLVVELGTMITLNDMLDMGGVVRDLRFGRVTPWDVLRETLFLLFEAYLVAAGTEEAAKWCMARYGAHHRVRERCVAAVMAVTLAGAMGFAASEHVMYSLQGCFVRSVVKSGSASVRQDGSGVQVIVEVLPWWYAALLSLLRASIAFPLHIGTAMLIGVDRAKAQVFERGGGGGGDNGDAGEQSAAAFVRSIWLPILFHGTQDAQAFFAPAVFGPAYAPYVSLALAVAIVAWLWRIGRRRFAALLESEAGSAVAAMYQA